jgi:thiosulfate/3-mercaptopyruvate sulfurtransferase
MKREDGTVFELPPVARLDSVFESKGVSDDSRVVVYFGRDWISPTARVYLTLDYLGFGERTFILDGGMGSWVVAGHPVTAERPPERRGSFTPRPRPDIVADVTWLSGHLSDPEIALIDSRNREFYTGEGLGNSVRAGHILGARSMPFTGLVDDSGHFKSREELTKMFADHGMDDGKTMVSYCHIGQQASLTYFVARYLGYDARMYDGSMNEWSRKPELPVVAGDE